MRECHDDSSDNLVYGLHPRICALGGDTDYDVGKSFPAMAEPAPPTPPDETNPSELGETTNLRGEIGQLTHIPALLNGTPVVFLYDTGCNFSAISEDLVMKKGLGYLRTPSANMVKVKTAGGPAVSSEQIVTQITFLGATVTAILHILPKGKEAQSSSLLLGTDISRDEATGTTWQDTMRAKWPVFPSNSRKATGMYSKDDISITYYIYYI